MTLCLQALSFFHGYQHNVWVPLICTSEILHKKGNNQACTFAYLVVLNSPRSIYQYSNMAPRLSGQTSIFDAVFFVSKSLLGIERQKNFKNLQFWPESLGEYWYIERGLLYWVSMALPQHVNKQYKTRLLLFLDYSRMENQHIMPVPVCTSSCDWHIFKSNKPRIKCF